MYKCPNCTAEMMEINFDKAYFGPGVSVAGCTTCSALFQVLPNHGGLVPLQSIFDVVNTTDERAMAAISKPTPATLKSLIELYNATTNRSALDLGALGSALMAHLAQVEGLLDSALSGLSEMAMVPGPAREVYAQVQRARELISTKPPKQRGMSTAVTVEVDG